jgi:hypothetical protein
MFIKVYEDAASYRGQMKTKCRLLVASHYFKLLSPHCPGQAEFMETVERNATMLRKNGFFLQDGTDENVLLVSCRVWPLLIYF